MRHVPQFLFIPGADTDTTYLLLSTISYYKHSKNKLLGLLLLFFNQLAKVHFPGQRIWAVFGFLV